MLAAVLGCGLVADLGREPERQLTARVLVAGLHLHRSTLSRWLVASGVRCRFEPSCSRYAEQCICTMGAARGSWQSVRRLLRCGPWTPQGTADSPPGVASVRDG